MGRQKGILPADQARRVEVEDALVDTGATELSMPKRLIQQLGLQPTRTRRARTAAASTTVQVYEAVRLTVQGRDCLSDVAKLPDDCRFCSVCCRSNTWISWSTRSASGSSGIRHMAVSR